MPVQLYDVFLRVVTALKDSCLGQSEGVGREWQNPWSGRLDDLAGMTEAFDRDEVNQGYAEVYAPDDPGSVGEAMAAKYQGDVVATVERAFRLRHASPLRAEAHAAARRTGLANDAGVYQDVVLRRAQDLVQAGLGSEDRSAGNTGE